MAYTRSPMLSAMMDAQDQMQPARVEAIQHKRPNTPLSYHDGMVKDAAGQWQPGQALHVRCWLKAAPEWLPIEAVKANRYPVESRFV